MPLWMTLTLVTDLTSSCAGKPAFLHSGHLWVDSHYWSKSVSFFSYHSIDMSVKQCIINNRKNNHQTYQMLTSVLPAHSLLKESHMWEKTKNGNPKFRIRKKDAIYMFQMYCPSTLMDRWINLCNGDLRQVGSNSRRLVTGHHIPHLVPGWGLPLFVSLWSLFCLCVYLSSLAEPT